MVLRAESLTALRAFVAAADTTSFTLAGQALGVSSSAIGKAIAKLESELTVALFHRTTRSIALTKEGAIYLDRVRHVLDELQEAEAELASTSGQPRGRLRVSLPLSGSVMTPAIGEFVRSYPDIELELDFSDRIVDIVADGFDIAIRTGPSTDSRLMSRKLADIHWALLASPQYIAASGRLSNAADLQHHTCLRQRLVSGKLMRWPLAPMTEQEVPSTFVANIIDPLIDLAVANVGIVAAPTFLVRDHLAGQRLTRVLEQETDASGLLTVLWPYSRFRSPKTRAFVDFFVNWSRTQNWSAA